MAEYTRVQLKDMVRRRSDMEDDGNFISDTEIYEYINEGLADLHDLQLLSDRGGVWVKNAPVLTDIGTFSFQLPTDFYKLKGVHYYYGNRYWPLLETAYHNYPFWASQDSLHKTKGRYAIRYDETNRIWELHVFPSTIDAANLAIMYAPKAFQFSDSVEVWDDISGWRDYVVVSSAIKCLTKEESDTSALQVELQRYAKEIMTQAGFVDGYMPDTILKGPIRPAGWEY